MRKLLLIEMSPATRAVVAAALLFFLVLSALIGDYAVATWRADEAVQHSQSVLCQVITLATAHPVPKPADPKANPSRESSYEFFEAFVTVGRQYHC